MDSSTDCTMNVRFVGEIKRGSKRMKEILAAVKADISASLHRQEVVQDTPVDKSR